MVTFIDLLTFFGVASFFAWLAYVALQNEQLDDYVFEDLKRQARVRLFTVYDFFLISFVCYAISFLADYLAQTHKMYLLFGLDTYNSPLLYGAVGAFFIVGLFTLALPIGYIRSMSKGNTTPLTVNSPRFRDTLWPLFAGLLNFGTAISEVTSIQHAGNLRLLHVWQGFWWVIILVAAIGFFLSFRDWDAHPFSRRFLRNSSLMWIPFASFLIAEYLLIDFGLLHCFDSSGVCLIAILSL